MIVTLVHTDLRLYWPARLLALHYELKSKGHELIVVEIAGAGSPYEFQSKNTNNALVDWRILYPTIRMEEISSPDANKAVYTVLNKINPDVVLAGAIAFPSGAAAVRWGALHQKPVIIFDNARLEDVPRSRFVNFIKRRIYSHVSAVICPSESHAPTFHWFGFKREQVFYGLNVIDNEYFAYSKMVALERQSYSVDLPQPCIVSAGRQVKKKNFATLIHAFNNFLRSHPESKLNLVLIGDGPEHDSLVEIAESEFKSRIHFYPFIDRDHLYEIYAKAELFILPSFYGETWGLVVNEAMASGLPVAVSKECGCADTLVKDKENGWKFDPHSIQALADVIQKFDSLDKDQLIAMQKRSLEIIDSWGMGRFVSGFTEAIQYVSTHKQSHSDLIGMVLLHIWKGRYRPS